MNVFFMNQKSIISDFIRNYICHYSENRVIESLSAFNVYKKILDFSLKGKMLRGSLVSFSASLFSDDFETGNTTACGAALEILQSSLLIHDDIMDNDTKRRGSDTIFYQFVKDALEQNHEDPFHTGISLGICTGDIAFFIAIDILNSLDTDNETKTRIIDLVSKEMTYVGMAQMIDVWWGTGEENIGEEDIINLYRFKTGRYTFSLPLMTGAILSGINDIDVETLSMIGEYLGILFQIKDDELGIFGNEIKLGKPVGSDIKEGKKTLFYHYLKEKVNDKEKQLLKSIYGNRECDENEINVFRELMLKYSIINQIDKKIEKIQEKMLDEIRKIKSLNDDAKSEINKLFQYNLSRSS